ncbi:MAG TPA: P-II family nitrogen regulator [Burkholderiaceae bacterium]|nr:P-II family nitrogen regulator [Burkholderiaceae bacterium]
MKMVTAIVQPLRLDDVIDALAAIGVDRITVTEVRGVGRSAPPKRDSPEAPPPPPLPPRTRIEMAVPADELPEVLAAIRKAAASGRPGDGKIFVSELARVIRIRDGAPEQ